MKNLCKLSIQNAILGLQNKDFSAAELTASHLDMMKKNKNLNAYISEFFEQAMRMAEESDRKLSKGEAGKLEGIPIAVKDLFCLKGSKTTAASRMLENFIPPYTSTVVQKLLDAGVAITGKTNMDEFAMGSDNTTSYFGPAINPWRSSSNPEQELTPGGSSGGSSSAVSGFMAMAALGSDTGGSIRQPASFTGLVGIKPSYGRCSRYGMIAFSSSLDQAGIFARNVTDASIILEEMMGIDPKDSTSVDIPAPNLLDTINAGIKDLKIGVPFNLMENKHLTPCTVEKWKKVTKLLEDSGAEIIDVNLDCVHYAVSVYYIIAPCEASSNLARYDGIRYGYCSGYENISNIDELYSNTRSTGFGNEVKRRLLIGTFALSASVKEAYYTKALKARRMVTDQLNTICKNVDSILLPSTLGEAFPVGQKFLSPTQMYFNDLFTIPASLAGLPALSLPVGLSKNDLPIGIQLVGKKFDEVKITRIAKSIEDLVNFKHKPGGLSE